MSSSLAPAECEPVGQFVQLVGVADPMATEYLPPAQASHGSASLVSACCLYLPGTHCVHGPPCGLEAPALHLQSVITVLESGAYECNPQLVHVGVVPSEKVSAGHTVHGAGPTEVLNFPAPHTKHVAPFAPVYPALHSQLCDDPLSAGDCACAGHGEQSASPLKENVSTSHGLQSLSSCDASTVECLPTPHAEHCMLCNSSLKNPAEHT